MSLDAQQVEDLQNSEPTDWSKFDQTVNVADFNRGMWQGDEKLHVRFFTLARIDVAESTKENRPIFKDVPYVEIMIPGDKNNIVVEPVWDQHKQRFPTQWSMFQRGEAEQVVGTPLKVAPFLTPALVAQFNHIHIVTIEQLASLADSNMGFPGAQEFKRAAQLFLDRTKSNDALLTRIKDLETKLEAQAAEKLQEQQAKVNPDVKKFNR
jgi:hypothetical protein